MSGPGSVHYSHQVSCAVLRTLLFIILAALLALTGLMACTAREPVQKSNVTSQFATVTRLQQAIQELFDTWIEAVRTKDAVLLHSTLSRDLGEICNTDKMQEWIEWTRSFNLETEDVQVISVFRDAGNPDRAMAELGVDPGQDGSSESQSLDAATAQSQIFPYQFLMEGGRWRTHFPVFEVAPQSCPFEIPTYLTSERDGGPDYPDIPGLDFSEMDDWSLERPALGTLRSLTSRSSGGSAEEYRIVLSGLMRTPLASGDLMDLYKENLADPSWDIREQGAGAEGAWLTWTVFANDGGLWYGSLAIAAVGVNLQQAWLSLRSSESGWPWSE